MITNHIKRTNSGYHRDEQLTNEHKEKELNSVTFQQNKSCMMIQKIIKYSFLNKLKLINHNYYFNNNINKII